MSPVDAFRPLNGFQSFGLPPSSMDPGLPAHLQSAASQRAQSTRAPSQRPSMSQKEPSEVGTIPTAPNGNTGSSHVTRERMHAPGECGDYSAAGQTDDGINGYPTSTLRPGASIVSDSTHTNSVQRTPAPLPLQTHMRHGVAGSMDSRNSRPKMQTLSPVPSAPNTLRTNADDPLATPTQSQARPMSPEEELNDYETEIVQGILSARTPRTSIAPSLLAEEIKRSNFHDEDLCILLHAADDPTQHDIVRKALRKAVAARIRKLGYKSDKESIRQYRKKFHDHDPSWHASHSPSYNPDVRANITSLRLISLTYSHVLGPAGLGERNDGPASIHGESCCRPWTSNCRIKEV